MQKSLNPEGSKHGHCCCPREVRGKNKDNYGVCPSEEAGAREKVSVRWRELKPGWELEGAMITHGQDPSSRERETGDSTQRM